MRSYSGRTVQSILLGVALGLLLYEPLAEAHGLKESKTDEPEVVTETVRVDLETFPGAEPQEAIAIPVVKKETAPVSTPDDIEEEMYWDSLELLACCVESEAGNQSKYGKALVCDVVLNRVDDQSGLFPNDIWDVIMQKYQFSVVLDGRIFQVDPTEETFEVVREELLHRTNTEVLFLRVKGGASTELPGKKLKNITLVRGEGGEIMLTDEERLTALINNLTNWSESSGSFHLEREDIPITLEALMRYKANRMMSELAERR